MQKFLSIVIPAFNEEKRIVNALMQILSFLKPKPYSYEVIVIDDGSKDKTFEKVEEIGKENPVIKTLRNRVNNGKGYSVKRGMLYSNARYVYFTDADLSTPIEEIDNFISEIENDKDVVIGSRQLGGSRIIVKQPFYRIYMGKIFNIIIRILRLTNMIDTQCGAKMFRYEVSQKIFSEQKINGFAFDVEVLFLAKKNNFKIAEIPVRWINSPDSKVRAIFDSLKMLKDIIKIRIIT